MSTSDFEWKPEYVTFLEEIAATDDVHSDWDTLRNAIKHKITENIALFLSQSQQPPPPAPFSASSRVSGGLKLPPFPPRPLHQLDKNRPPVNYMNEAQALDMKESIFQQLDEFDSHPPFTIQRVCELCLHPTQQYSSLGKYLRAVEKSLLVTSTWDSFPRLTEKEMDASIRGGIILGPASSVPTTPLFSPIPFLHNDARRSQSRSPPPSPLALGGTTPLIGGNVEPLDALEPKALGLVDELDDPSPGHMSDHPTALTSVTTVDPGGFIPSLEQRFVKSEESLEPETHDGDAMMVDEDKENAGA